jgi:hypothetical protein
MAKRKARSLDGAGSIRIRCKEEVYRSKMVAEQWRHPGSRSLLIVNPKIEMHIAMTWRRGTLLSHAAKVWLTLVREKYSGA